MNDPSHEPNLRVLSNLERFEKVALWAIAAIAAATLAVWSLPPLAGIVHAGVLQLKASTAIGLLLAVASLRMSAPRASARSRRASKIAAVAVLTLGALVLLSYSGLFPFHPQSWPLRPSPQTAFSLLLAGVCLTFIRASKGRLSLMADGTAVVLATFVLILFGGYVFRAGEIVGVDASNLTSPQTLFCLFLLSGVIASRRASEGVLLAILVNKGIGSQIARLVLPAIIVAPFVMFAVIAYLNETGLVATNHTRSVMAPLMTLLTFGVMAWMGQRTNDLERQLRMQSLTDQLTGILNRRGFAAVAEYVMRNAQRTESGLTAFYFDLDGLKRANDDLGHEAGSLIIKTFADLLVATFRKNDVVARIGGDEFLVLAAGTSDSTADALTRLARNVAESNAAGLVAGGIAYSVGYAELLPGSARKLEELVAAADQMMYANKSLKKAA